MAVDEQSSLTPDRSVQGRRWFDEGLREFEAGRYFEAHDIWEEFWHELRGDDRRYLQAMIHLAVGAYHYENANIKGAKSQWRKAATKLSQYPDRHWGIDTSAWRGWIGRYLSGESDAPHPHSLPFDPDSFPCRLPMAPT